MKRIFIVFTGFIIVCIVCISILLFLLDEKESTVYSSNYKESSFMQISIGMSKREVFILLGFPLLIHTIADTGARGEALKDRRIIEKYVKASIEKKGAIPDYHLKKEYWSFSKQNTTTSDYYVRRIVFDKKGVVTDIISEIYYD